MPGAKQRSETGGTATTPRKHDALIASTHSSHWLKVQSVMPPLDQFLLSVERQSQPPVCGGNSCDRKQGPFSDRPQAPITCCGNRWLPQQDATNSNTYVVFATQLAYPTFRRGDEPRLTTGAVHEYCHTAFCSCCCCRVDTWELVKTSSFRLYHVYSCGIDAAAGHGQTLLVACRSSSSSRPRRAMQSAARNLVRCC